MHGLHAAARTTCTDRTVTTDEGYTPIVVAEPVVTSASDRGPTDFTLPDASSIGEIRGATVNTERRVAATSHALTPGNDAGRTRATSDEPGNDHEPVVFDDFVASSQPTNESVDVPAVDVTAGRLTLTDNSAGITAATKVFALTDVDAVVAE